MSQVIEPGGVFGAKIWFHTHVNQQGAVAWENLLSKNKTLSFASKPPFFHVGTLNFHPAAHLNAPQDLSMILGKTDLSQVTIFTVYQPEDGFGEKLIWHLNTLDETALMMTTHRAADLEKRKYFNLDLQRVNLPRLSTFTQYKKNARGNPWYTTLHFGALPEQHTLPITHFEGLIPEVIIFDRVLTTEERIRVESYLALKYGLSLYPNGPSKYLNAQGEVIWDGTKNAPAFFNITGIGRDDLSGLYQKQSSSSYDPGLLTIGAHKIAQNNLENNATLLDNHFLIWGDDGANLEFCKSKTNTNLTLLRKWTIANFGENHWNIPSSVSFDFAKAKKTNDPKEYHWLIIDRSGSGKFSKESVEFIPASTIAAEGKAIFSKIIWDQDQSGKDVFTFGTSLQADPNNWDFELEQHSSPNPVVSGLIEKLMLYPNPVSKSHFFNLEIGLQQTNSANIHIYDAQGKLVLQRFLQGSSYYFYTGQINTPGMYTLQVKVNDVLKTFPFLVE